MGFAVSIVFFLLALMWFLLLRAVPKKQEQTKSSHNEHSTAIEPAAAPFALIPDLLHEDDDIGAVSSIIVATLAAQKACVSGDANDLPDRARDNFSIGYIGGYVDAILRRKRIATMRTGYTIGELVFVDIFGRADGFPYYERYLSLQQASDTDVFAGMAAGETDIGEWLKNNLNAPFGWGDYLRDTPGAA